MFFGTKFSDNDVKTQEEKTYTLKENFSSDIVPRFDDILADIATLKNNAGNKTQIENWYDTLKKVMRLYNSKQFAQNQGKDAKIKKAQNEIEKY